VPQAIPAPASIPLGRAISFPPPAPIRTPAVLSLPSAAPISMPTQQELIGARIPAILRVEARTVFGGPSEGDAVASAIARRMQEIGALT
jgi:hypothetical protein